MSTPPQSHEGLIEELEAAGEWALDCGFRNHAGAIRRAAEALRLSAVDNDKMREALKQISGDVDAVIAGTVSPHEGLALIAITAGAVLCLREAADPACNPLPPSA